VKTGGKLTFNGLHGFISQEIELFTFHTVSTVGALHTAARIFILSRVSVNTDGVSIGNRIY
jgi:hypothetical protein